MSPEDQYDAYIKAPRGTGGWRDQFLTDPAPVMLQTVRGPRRYVPKGGYRGVWLLDDGVHAFDEAVACWEANMADPRLLVGEKSGYADIIRQAGYQFTWEWALIDPARPWSARVELTLRGFILNDLVRWTDHFRTQTVVQAVVAKKLATTP